MADMLLLERLCRANGISGDEGAVRNIILDEIISYADEINIDPLGNLLLFYQHKNRHLLLNILWYPYPILLVNKLRLRQAHPHTLYDILNDIWYFLLGILS